MSDLGRLWLGLTVVALGALFLLDETNATSLLDDHADGVRAPWAFLVRRARSSTPSREDRSSPGCHLRAPADDYMAAADDAELVIMPASPLTSVERGRTARPVLSRLLVGCDGSDSANAAAAFGLWLAAKAGCRTTLAHVVPSPDAGASPELLPVLSDQALAYKAEWQRRLESLRDYAAEGAAVDYRLISGMPSAELIATAADSEADLVLVGSHGAGRVRGALIGSVSSQLLSHSPCSVMLFHEDGPGVPAAHARTVVVGIDGSPSSRHVLELAQALAVPLGAALVLLHAYDEHIPYVSEPTEAMRAEMRRHASAIVHEARATVAAPLDVVEEQVVAGPARRELVAACKRHAPALLVVGSRGRGGFKELLLGSTSRWVANCAPCPVVVARPPHWPK